ncbi:hypothetical protein [Photobacterium sp.]|uniref:hypothetical protein n=1 Tax=Photobacterium sp. TaxID=660 RepID=UPI00299ECFF5|nr:hypothetical protein [Photobacterium sp.]MDX1303029.1 hypothetical protein [Photobacterium sp.]
MLNMKVMLPIVFLFSAPLAAEQITTPKTVKRVFSEGTTSAGFYTNEGISQCKWGIMYMDLSTESGKAQFSQVLTAKTAGFKVIRIDYTIRSSGTCLASGIHIQ